MISENICSFIRIFNATYSTLQSRLSLVAITRKIINYKHKKLITDATYK